MAGRAIPHGPEAMTPAWLTDSAAGELSDHTGGSDLGHVAAAWLTGVDDAAGTPHPDLQLA